MSKFKILITCPPMIKQINNYNEYFEKYDLDFFCPEFEQTLTEEQLIQLLPQYDGWIIGDDPATQEVLKAGKIGLLKAVVKWGVGTDNVDFEACQQLSIPITNIPNVFGEEVSDVAIGYVLNLSRQLHEIHLGHLEKKWLKPCGQSLSNKKFCLVGFGDIGRCVARKLLAFKTQVWVSDPSFSKIDGHIKPSNNYPIKLDEEILDQLKNVEIASLEECLDQADYIVVCCALNHHTYYLIDETNIRKSQKGVKIINVSRGPVVKEDDIIKLLEEGFVSAIGFDVFETEPLPLDSLLRKYPQNIFGSHNGSNTIEAVNKTSLIAIQTIWEYLLPFRYNLA